MQLVDLNQTNELTLGDGVFARIVTGGNITIAHIRFKAGAVVPEHQHTNEQIVNVIDGELELTVQGKAYTLTPGQVMVLEPNIPHAARAVTACRVLDAFHPVREDFKSASFSGYPDKE